MKKFIPRKEISNLVSTLKREKKNVVTYNGSFDVLHEGHIKSIEEAKQQGDILIILLNSDQSIKLYKGSTRPINNLNKRIEQLGLIPEVDYITTFDEINPKKILSEIKPDIHCCGSDWGENCIERSVVENNGGKIFVLTWIKGFSSTNVIRQKTHHVDTTKAVFLDRDGTINDNKKGYISKRTEFDFLPGVLDSLKKLSETEYKIIIITNQSGIGRGYYSEEDFHELNNWMLETLRAKNVRIDKVYHCPHVESDDCTCRKPKLGMLLKAVSDYDINLSKSWVVGDSPVDIILGREANTRTIKIGDRMPTSLRIEPHFYVSSLPEAIDIILKNYER